jgi:uncharacterized membrane protein YeiH
MTVPLEPLSNSILAIMYFGDVVFAVSGALTAARYRMDVLGFVLIGTITGIGGGTIRDLLLGRTVWWTQDPTELLLCVAASLITFLFIRSDITRKKGMIWSDALGLAAFGVIGCHIALESGAPIVIAVFMGMVTATGGGVIRDLLTNTEPMILCGPALCHGCASWCLELRRSSRSGHAGYRRPTDRVSGGILAPRIGHYLEHPHGATGGVYPDRQERGTIQANSSTL